MRSSYRYGNINMLIALVISIMLMVGIASCKPKAATERKQESNDMPGMDMKSMKGMDMKEHSTADTAPKLDIKVDDLIKPVNQNIISTIATIHLKKSNQKLIVTAKGIIQYDQRRFSNIASRVAGRVESTTVKFQFQPVKKGQLLFTIYSPELQNTQQDFLFLSNDTSNRALIKAAREKLMLLGLSIEQISEIQNSKKVPNTISIYAPANGYIIANNGQQSFSSMPGTSSNIGGDMMGSSSTTSSTSAPVSNEPILREGQYVNKGETVFRIVNTEMVWGILQIFPDDVSKIKTGNSVTIKLDGNESYSVQARIDFIEKVFIGKDKTLAARVYISNINSLYKIGDLISAFITAGEKEALWVPREAVLDIGNSQVVFVKQGNVFKAKAVHTGLTNGKSVELVSGISSTDEIVANAQYLVDSEAFIKTE